MKHLNFKNLFCQKKQVNLMVIAITIVFLFSFVSPAFCGGAQAADTGLKATADASGLPTGGDLTTIIGQIIYTILGFLGVAFVILVLYGGAIRMFAKGEPGKIKDSTGIITSAAVGVAIILLSYIITAFVISQIKSNIGAGSENSSTVQNVPEASLYANGCCTLTYIVSGIPGEQHQQLDNQTDDSCDCDNTQSLIGISNDILSSCSATFVSGSCPINGQQCNAQGGMCVSNCTQIPLGRLDCATGLTCCMNTPVGL